MTILPCPVCASPTRLYEHANDCYRPFITNYSIYCMNDDCFYGLESSPNELDIIEKHNKLAIYVMAGKLMEKRVIATLMKDGKSYEWGRLYPESRTLDLIYETDQFGFATWESAVRDAYETLLKEAK